MCNLTEDQYFNQAIKQRRSFIKSIGLASIGLSLPSSLVAKNSPKPNNEISANEALERLKAGNERYATGASKLHDFETEREALVGGQNPFASILSCSDSRIAPEYAFDSSRGDLFVVRVAGNFVSKNGLASLEYASKYLGTKLIMVLGHQSCGAVASAIKTIKEGAVLPGHLPLLVESIGPAVGFAMNQPGDILDNAIRENIRINIAKLQAASPILSLMVTRNEVRIVGGIYRLDTGKVELISL